MWRCELDLCDTSVHGNKPSGSIKGEEFYYQLNGEVIYHEGDEVTLLREVVPIYQRLRCHFLGGSIIQVTASHLFFDMVVLYAVVTEKV